MLAVVLRYGMAQRHRTEYDVFGQNDANGGTERPLEVDSVKAMVAGVKEQGVSRHFFPRLQFRSWITNGGAFKFQGKELMKYVKGLLG